MPTNRYLAEESQLFKIVNTLSHKGLYMYKRLPFGMASAPVIFQQIMQTLLQKLHGVCVYLDNIQVTGGTTEEHLHNLKEVLKCLEEASMRLKKDKCAFLLPKVKYLEHVISQLGLHPSNSRQVEQF